jgi:hypothetical protein
MFPTGKIPALTERLFSAMTVSIVGILGPGLNRKLLNNSKNYAPTTTDARTQP